MRLMLSSAIVLGALGLAACGGGESSKPVTPANSSASGSAATPGTGGVTGITGAGASFPQPIYAQVAQDYNAAKGSQVNYQSIGSSGGVKQINAKTVDFGATDAPLSKEDLDKNGLIQFPTVIGGVVAIVNIDGVEPGKLKLDGATLANIYLGKITKWSDPAIKALNPDVTLPDAVITTVFRSDGSGTSFNFTNYLSAVSPEWKEKVGAANSVKWPTATGTAGTAGKGNEGVANFVRTVKNSIGYVEYAYAKQNNMSHVSLKNKAGNFVQPSLETFSAAAKADWKSAPGFGLILTDQADANAWPIASATFILVHAKPQDAAKAKATLSYFDWVYNSGDDAASKLDYVPLPADVKALVRESWKQVVDAEGKPVL